MSRYIVIYEEDGTGSWGAYVPDLPGVVAVDKTRQGVEERIKEAVAAHVDFVRERGVAVPEPSHEAGTVQV
jgi:predicted RNase H-like HicB family nuclease